MRFFASYTAAMIVTLLVGSSAIALVSDTASACNPDEQPCWPGVNDCDGAASVGWWHCQYCYEYQPGLWACALCTVWINAGIEQVCL